MSTVATAAMKQLSSDWAKTCGLKSATPSGIVGDARHMKTGGYHLGRAFQPSSSNYSVVRPDDKLGPDNAAAAIDMTMSHPDMITCTNRLVAAYTNLQDPRRKYLNAFNGTQDGKTARRWDIYARKTKSATQDHTEHVHMEIRRKYVDSAVAMKAILSILRGQSVAAYLKEAGTTGSVASTGSTSTPPSFTATLKRGSSVSPAVRQFQSQLLKRGVSSIGVADGLFGPKLESAVKDLQAAAGLVVDGVIGPKTWPLPWTAKSVK